MGKIEIYKAFIAFQNECPKLQLNSTVNVKTKTGATYNFKYADLTTIHDTVKPLLSKHKLGFTQLFDGHNIVTLLMHESGETITSSFDISNYLNNTNPQDAGGVITYFKRYSLSAILGLASEEDDDANAAIGNEIKSQKKEYKEDNRPWLSDKQFNTAINKIRNADFGELTKDQFKNKLFTEFKMKNQYKEEIEIELNSPFNNALNK